MRFQLDAVVPLSLLGLLLNLVCEGEPQIWGTKKKARSECSCQLLPIAAVSCGLLCPWGQYESVS